MGGKGKNICQNTPKNFFPDSVFLEGAEIEGSGLFHALKFWFDKKLGFYMYTVYRGKYFRKYKYDFKR